MNKIQTNNDTLTPLLGKYYLIFLSSIIIVIFILYFVILKVDISEYIKYLTTINANIMNEELIKLSNANTIGNLPDIILDTNNSDITNLQNCKGNVTYIGPIDETNFEKYNNICKNKCGGSGELLIVETSNDYIFNNEFLNPGVYCTVEPQNCNMNTGYVVATVNSVVCKSKYPKLFGGSTASTIIACNDELYPATGSVLWDYANNEPVNTTTIKMTNEDETLPDGSFRFRCKFGETENGNPYIEHPLDRFHPIKDKCNNAIYRASYEVHAVVENNTWYCDCGNPTETRVDHLDPNNPKSICISCLNKSDETNRTYEAPYICFRQSSPYNFPTFSPPHLELSTIEGAACGTLKIRATTKDTIDMRIFTKTENDINLDNLSLKYNVYY